MAEKKVIVFTCDRCGNDHQRLRGKTLPAGWVIVQGKDLCPSCARALVQFLEPLPDEAPKLVVRQAVPPLLVDKLHAVGVLVE